ncbi:predicted protein [Sparassis crispa]|uniref:Cytochrome P450 n=1 Tax=Sparassis crispa TaxID=139825 RepID=A0A401GA18_9APHY|nr:predicted protein [Sparassis crispa]GBE78989.1 predicted protein [Sparassis crispa]
MWGKVFVAAFVVFLTTRILRFRANLKTVGNLPGLRSIFNPFSLPGAITPTFYLNAGLNWHWLWRRSIYKYYGKQTISCVPVLHGAPTVYTISQDVAKQILTAGRGFFKSPESTAALMLWGDNVVSSNYDAYKKHRRIVGPAFTGATYAFVAKETVHLYYEMVDGEDWSQKQVVIIDSINRYLSKFALGIVTRCGFGLPFTWVASTEEADELSFDKALAIVSEGAVTRLATPGWAYKLPMEKLHELDNAYRQLSAFMSSFVTNKKEELSSSADPVEGAGSDLFTRLVTASEAEGKDGLAESELIGNIFTFMFAGHETTAHTLAATVAMLALHEKEQDDVYKHIQEVLPNGRDPTFEDYARLDKVLACFQESARLFPAGFVVTRDTTETVTLKIPPEDGGGTLVLPPGVRIIIDMIGLHYNPNLFQDPERFDPSRWLGIAESELSFFGLGPRACLGRKFAMTEAVCFLTLLVRDWELGVSLGEGESKAQWRERVMQGRMLGLTFGVPNIPVRLRRRRAT